ncbi:DUF4834 family protein [Flavivirga spongiicola]|uniref:DUF4834 family protein n=1 Tax=Flavivirga spongiicola TaxID=421621 RepID=A0ABU7XYA4_9FLAO|nr:DUF4834 family protein [Flavivirga sp. MEBiC05379]MDO5980433.1 DUF4834 family protein [Flavivirga sp. MEBiC05379]
MLQFASVTGFVRMILIILLIYFGIKILSRLFAPFLVKYVAKKAEQRFGDQFGQFGKQQQEKQKKEGEVSIDKIPKTKTSNKNVGDYVDYEEID